MDRRVIPVAWFSLRGRVTAAPQPQAWLSAPGIHRFVATALLHQVWAFSSRRRKLWKHKRQCHSFLTPFLARRRRAGGLQALKQQYPQLGALADQREQLRAIFEDRTVVTAEAGRSRLEAWCVQARQLGLKAMEKLIKTLGNWMDKIANYFVSRSSNGRTEGFNHGIRAILWRAFGMKNFAHFRLRVLDLFG